jgi:pyruvate/2-oxoglutarate dehydrogenase complex dihydrolipoamide dehydrogenase (E3) component
VQTFAYDLVVVGAGSGGYAAARTARALGANVALVDHGPLGGLCILKGCMPSKALIASSDRAHDVRVAERLGVDAAEPEIDFAHIMARKRSLVEGFAGERIGQLMAYPVYAGAARFESATELRVGDDVTLNAGSFIIATGSVVAPPVIPGLKETGYVDSDAALSLERRPSSLIVLGGGYVAAELGQFYARVGVPTTFVLRAPHVLSTEDDDVGDALTAALRADGMAVETCAQVDRVERAGERKRVSYTQHGRQHSVEADEILYALGRVPNIEGLNLEAAGITYHAITGVEVDATMRTANSLIFAVGDVTGVYPLVHVAIYQGELAARNAVNGTDDRADYSLQKTHAIFTDPQVAIAGQTEKDLLRAGVDYVAGSYPFADHGKAMVLDKLVGFVKMMAAPRDGRILGAAVVGSHGSDLIHEVVVAMNYGATVYDFLKVPHIHPTMAEIWTYPPEIIAEKIEAMRAGAPPTVPVAVADPV